MIRRCTDDDIPAIDTIINEASAIYRGAIPDDCWHEPYMSRAEETVRLLRTYWRISPRQQEVSVVLNQRNAIGRIARND